MQVSSLGNRVIQVTVGGGDQASNERSGSSPSSLVIVHESLLCYYSRFFAAHLNTQPDKEILAEVLLDVESKQKEMAMYMSRWQSSLLKEKDAPQGYVPSWMTFAC